MMRLALAQAVQAKELGEVPVGAVLLDADGQLLATGFNRTIVDHDPTAHAEIVALRDACQNIQNYRLPDDAVLYVTLEPCTMCVGALVHSRVSRVVFGAFEAKAGSLVSARQLFETGYYNHVFSFQAGCMQQQCSEQLSAFFKLRREQKRQFKLQEKLLNTQK